MTLLGKNDTFSHEIMKLYPICAVGAAVLAAQLSAVFGANAPKLAFDHVWIHVKQNAPEAKVLAEAGLKLSPWTKQHTGMGTASVFFFFFDTCLELIWVEDPEALRRTAPEFARTLLAGSKASPFGVGLSRVSEDSDALPFDTVAIRAEWIRTGQSIQVARSLSIDDPAPSIFVVPRYMAVAARQDEFAAHSVHRLGVGRISSVRIRGPGLPSESPAVRVLVAQQLVDFASSADSVLELEFDGARKGAVFDARPHLPLVIRY